MISRSLYVRLIKKKTNIFFADMFPSSISNFSQIQSPKSIIAYLGMHTYIHRSVSIQANTKNKSESTQKGETAYSAIFQNLTGTIVSSKCSLGTSSCATASVQYELRRISAALQRLLTEVRYGRLDCPGWVEASHVTFERCYQPPAGR